MTPNINACMTRVMQQIEDLRLTGNERSRVIVAMQDLEKHIAIDCKALQDQVEKLGHELKGAAEKIKNVMEHG